MKNLIILGACGSIGTQTIDILKLKRKEYNLIGISIGRDLNKARKILNEFDVEIVCTRREEDILILEKEFPNIKYVFGDNGLIELSKYKEDEDIIIENALVGSCGIMPTYVALSIGRDILLANKETLVSAGDIIMGKAKEKNARVFPIDSEHSAIYQCLVGENKENIKRLIITCSGGAFRDVDKSKLEYMTKEDALKHPNWSMGEKITIDCATLMNKGFEVIEAHHLFDIPYSKIDVLIHKESIVHSLVEFKDSQIKAQLGNPDMRMPISYALSYPTRFEYNNELDLTQKPLTFKEVDYDKYPCFGLALDCAKIGNIYPCVLNSANEVCVNLFLDGKIGYNDIYRIIKKYVDKQKPVEELSIEVILNTDKEIKEMIKKEYEKT